MASNPYFYNPQPTYSDFEVSRDTSEYDRQLGQAIASRPTGLRLPARGNIAYNPNTQEYAVNGQVVGKLGIGELENYLKQSMEAGPQGAPVPEGFQSVDESRFAAVLGEARKDPTADLSSVWSSAKRSLGSLASTVGAVAGENDLRNPWGDAVEQSRIEQPWAEQASHDEMTNWFSTAGLGTNLAQGFGQLLPAIGAGAINPALGVATLVGTNAGAQADSAYEQLYAAANDMTPAELAQSSPAYREILQNNPNMTHDQAVAELAATARRWGLGVGAVEGGLTALLGGKLLAGVVKRFGGEAFINNLTKSGLGRVFKPFEGVGGWKGMAGTGLAAGVTEGSGAIAGDYAVNERAMQQLGQDASYGLRDAWDSFSTEAPLGFVFGALGTSRRAPRGDGEDDGAPPPNPAAGTDLAMVGKGLPRRRSPMDGVLDTTPVNPELRGPRPTGLLGQDPIDVEFTDVTPVPPNLPPPPSGPTAPRGLPAPQQRALPAPEPDVNNGQPTINVPAGGFQYSPSQDPEFTGQGELDLQPNTAPDVTGNYSTNLMEDAYPRQNSPQGDMFAQNDRPASDPLYQPSAAVAQYFNQSVIPLVRQRENEKGVGQDSPFQEILPAEEMSPAQVISSIRQAQARGLLTKQEAAVGVRKVASLAKQSEFGPATAQPRQAPTPAPEPAPVQPAAEVAPEPAPTPEPAPKAAKAKQTAQNRAKNRGAGRPLSKQEVAQGAAVVADNPAASTAEGEGSLAVQTEEVVEGNKKATLIPPADQRGGKLPPKVKAIVDRENLPTTKTPQGELIGGKGRKGKAVIATAQKKVAKGAMDDKAMAEALGYEIEKADSDGSAILVLDKNKNVVQEELTTVDKLESRLKDLQKQYSGDKYTFEYATGEYGVKLVLKERKRKVDAEARKARVAKVKADAVPEVTAPVDTPEATAEVDLAALRDIAEKTIARITKNPKYIKQAKKVSTPEELYALYEEVKGEPLDDTRRIAIEKYVEGKKGVGKSPTSSQSENQSEKPSTPQTTSATEKPRSSTPKADKSSSRGKKPTAAAVKKIRKAVDEFTKGLRADAPLAVVVDTAEDLPQSVKDAFPDYANAEAFYDSESNTVYVVAANVTEGDIPRVLTHEVIGHYGIDNVVGEENWLEIELDLEKLVRSGKYKAFFDQLDKDYPPDQFSVRERAMEAVARIAELQPDAKVVQKVVAFIKRTLAAINIKVSSGDILADLPETIRRAIEASHSFVSTEQAPRAKRSKRGIRSASPSMRRQATADNAFKKVAETLSKRARAAKNSTIGTTLLEVIHNIMTLRDMQDFYGGETLWGRAYHNLAKLLFAKNAFINNQLSKLAEQSRHYMALTGEKKKAVRELMLASQERSLNPMMALADHLWINKSLRRHPDVVAAHKELEAMWEALGEDGQRAFRGLADENRRVAVEYINARIDNYNVLRDIKPEQGGVAEDIVDARLKELNDELEQVTKGNINFSTQRIGDWIVVVPHNGKLGALIGEFDSEEEADAEVQNIKARTPYTKADVTKVGEKWEVRINEPTLRTFDSKAEAEAGIAALREEIYADMLKNFNGDTAKADEAMADIWETKSPDDPTKTIPRVVAKKRSLSYNEREYGSFAPAQIKRLNDLLRNEKITKAAYNTLMEDYLRAADATSVTLSRLRRKLVRGATESDMMTAYVTRYTSMVHALANARVHVEELGLRDQLESSALQDSYIAMTGKDPVIGLNALTKHEEATATMLKRSVSNQFLQTVRGLTTFLNLALSPAYAMMNMTQPVVIGIPYLASKTIGDHKVTYAEATAAVKDAMLSVSGQKRLLEEIAAGVAADAKVIFNKSVTREQFTDSAVAEIIDKWTAGMTPAQKAGFTELVLGRVDKDGNRYGGLMENDALALSYTDSIYDAMNVTKTGDVIKRVERMSMALGKLTEVANRLTMARAAYTLGTEYGLKGSELTDFVEQAIYRSQGDFSRTNRAAAFNNPWVGTALQFKTYVQLIYGLFIRSASMALRGKTAEEKREGRRMLGGMVTMHALIGGFTGLGPITWMLKILLVGILGFGGSDDEEMDEFLSMDAQWRRGLREMLKDPAGESMLYAALTSGVPAAILGVDASERMAIPSLVDTRFVRVDPNNPNASFINGVIAQAVGGAPYSTILRLYDGVSMMGNGIGDGDTRDFYLGLSKVMPQIIANSIKAGDKNLRGVIDQSGREIVEVDKIGVGDILTNIMGFRTYEETSTQKKRGDFFKTKADVNERRNELLKDYRRARGADRERIRQTIREFNKTVPPELHITEGTLAKSMKQAERSPENKDDQALRAWIR
jgi:hypothetical protein